MAQQKPHITVEKQYELKFKSWMENVRSFIIKGDGKGDKFQLICLTPMETGLKNMKLHCKPNTCDENLVLVKYTPHGNRTGRPEEIKLKMKIKHEKDENPKFFDLILKFDDEAPEYKVSEQGDSTHCSICANRFDRKSFVPKVLACGHTFCGECLYMIQYEGFHKFPSDFRCPTDRKRIEQYSQNLSENFSLLDMMEEADNKLAQKAPITSCLEDKDHHPEVYCKACEEAYCESCFGKLHSFKAMKNHTAVPIEEICSKHRKPTKFVCSDHSHESWQKRFCDICQKNGTHSEHNHESLEEYEAKRIKQLEKLLKKIGAREKQAHEQLELFEEYYLTYDEDGVVMKKSKLECEINFGEKIWKTVSDIAKSKKNKLIEGKAKLEEMLRTAEKYKEEVKKVMEKKFDAKDIKKQLSNIYDFAKQKPEELYPSTYYMFTGASALNRSGNKRDLEKEDEREAKIPRIDNEIIVIE